MHEKYVDEIIKNGNEKDMQCLEKIFNELMDHIKECDIDMYDRIELKLYVTAYGEKFTEDMAKDWVSSMLPVHQYWTIEETTEAMKNLDYDLDNIEFYITANMMMNDYNDITRDNPELALKMAKDWLEDEDAVDNKLFEYWSNIVKK